MKVAIVGNPNCGKTTIFNALTGANQKVGNWSGVTVDKKVGHFNYDGIDVDVVDLPGIYSLISSDENSLDEQIACRFILNEKPDAVINVIDTSNLERNLYLTMQLIEMQVPVILALNMVDVAKERGMLIYFDKLAKEIGCSVIPLVGRKKIGIDELKQAVAFKKFKVPSYNVYKNLITQISTYIKAVIEALPANTKEYSSWVALRVLESDCVVENIISKSDYQKVLAIKNKIISSDNKTNDVNISIARYKTINTLIDEFCDFKKEKKHRLTEVVDKICLNKYLGIPVFLLVMYLMFEFAITIGGALQPLFDDSSKVIFIDGVAHLGYLAGLPLWLTAVLSQGIGLGVNTVLTFIPQIGCMFLFLSFLEDSGYMSRAAFVMDRFMQSVGLPGKSFVPLIVGFGCNVPAVMATRTLETRRDRLLTIMMAPFISCGARLAIFAVFAAAFFPNNGASVVFLLYIIGIAMAILTGLVVKNTLLKGDNTPFIMELPVYHLPNFKTIVIHSWNRLKRFITRAGKVIIPVCLLVGTLNSIQVNGTVDINASQNSLLSKIGQTITPVLKPMGVQQDNWPATVGLITGTLAKEVVVGTLNTLYTQEKSNELNNAASDKFEFWHELGASLTNTIDGFKAMTFSSFANPFTANEADSNMNSTAMGTMVTSFGTMAAAFAYLLFVLLYVPCVATIGATAREGGKGWAWMSVIWSFAIAYVAAVVVYQLTQILANPVYAITSIGLSLAFIAALIIGMYYSAQKMTFKTKVNLPCSESCSVATEGCH